MIVLDASVLIGHLDAADAHHDRAGVLLAAAGAEPFAASPITLAEVLVGPARSGHLDRVVVALSQLGVVGVPLDDQSPLRLAVLRAGTGLRMPDCCVLLAAEQTRGVVATFDGALAAAAGDLGLAVLDR